MYTETEYKILVEKNVFEKILNDYPNKNFTIQTNYYFDTKNHLLKQNHLMLRIRIKNNNQNEITLKIPKDSLVNTEITQKVNNVIFKNNLPILKVEDPSILRTLKNINILPNQLICIGFLITKRWQSMGENGALCFDENKYLNEIDYEIEYELKNENSNTNTFFNLTKKYNLQYTKNSHSKYKRLLDKLEEAK